MQLQFEIKLKRQISELTGTPLKRQLSGISSTSLAEYLPVSHVINPTAQIIKFDTLMAIRCMINKNTDVNLYFSGHAREQGADWACFNDMYISPDDINELCVGRTNLTIYLDCSYAEKWADRF